MIEAGFSSAGKSAHALELAQGLKSFVALSQYLVGIALVAHIPDNGVMSGIKGMKEGQRQFDNTQGRS
jgi:hypothetical protein